jgi:predicted acyl esterase
MTFRPLILTLFLCSSVLAKETIMLPMRDGIKLATDIHKPVGEARHPVILIRTPYNKDGNAAIGTEGIKRGYIVVAQDCRGRFASEGENLPFDKDKPDGYDTIEWVSKQPWCNGKIGTWGGSAVAITQFQMLASGTDKITAQHLTVGAPNLYDVIYINGVFRKSLIEDWLRIAKWSPHALPVWVAHPTYDEYWRERDASRHYKRAVPAVHIGGYWDIFAQATIDAFVGYQKHGDRDVREKQKLIIGPWAHAVLHEKVGELTFRDGKKPIGTAHDAWSWFDFTLKDNTSKVMAQPAVTYYVLGDATDPKAPGNVWRTAETWPPFKAEGTKYYLHSDRTLSRNDPVINGNPLTYIYEPANPAPTVGGIQLSIPAGPMDQKKVESRDDVLVFTSVPLTAPLEVTGRIHAKIWVSTDVPDTDFIARLCDVYPDGRSFNLCEGAVRARFLDGLGKEKLLKAGKIYLIELDLWSTSVIFNTGHRLRLQITSSSTPGYDPNPNTGAEFRSEKETRKATVKLFADKEHPSHLLLPVITPSQP